MKGFKPILHYTKDLTLSIPLWTPFSVKWAGVGAAVVVQEDEVEEEVGAQEQPGKRGVCTESGAVSLHQ